VRRAPTTILVTALLLTACSGGADDLLELQATEEPAASVEDPDPSPSPEEEPAPEDPYAVPDEIDEAYVERVINAILEVQDGVLREALQLRQGENLSADLTGLILATAVGEQRRLTLDRLQDYVDDPSSRGNLLPPDEMGRTYFELQSLIHAEPERCLVAVGHWDNTEMTSSPRADDDFVAFSLSRIPLGEAVSDGNPTPWQWRDNAAMADGQGPIPSDRWQELDYDSAIDNTCEAL
jgi:hypothetical protein